MEQFKRRLVSLNDQSLDEAAKGVWATERKQLEQIVERLAAAKDIAGARAEFALLSDEMLVLVQRFQVSDSGDIYELHCPMAFDGRGATWLQNNDQPQNPYYGASMLTCADRVRKIETTVHADAEQGRASA